MDRRTAPVPAERVWVSGKHILPPSDLCCALRGRELGPLPKLGCLHSCLSSISVSSAPSGPGPPPPASPAASCLTGQGAAEQRSVRGALVFLRGHPCSPWPSSLLPEPLLLPPHRCLWSPHLSTARVTFLDLKSGLLSFHLKASMASRL